MKKLFTLITTLFLSFLTMAQIPEKMSYQAVVRNAAGELITEQQVGIRISILQGSATGSQIYSETQTPVTNTNGLMSIEIGGIELLNINWADGPFFIKTETDPTGASNYTIMGVSQILSVPYALHAHSADVLTGEIDETDPVFTAWDKSSGIEITESQIIDLQDYLTDEVDPIFEAWDRSEGITISENQIHDLQNYLTSINEQSIGYLEDVDLSGLSNGMVLQFDLELNKWIVTELEAFGFETDPIFMAWDRSTGIVISEGQISDLGNYLTDETDPLFTLWDKSTGIEITESQISDLQDYLTEETDPLFSAWDKSTGIVISESQISDLGNYLINETDPLFTLWDKSTGIEITESQISDLQDYLTEETDPLFSAWDKSTGIVISESQISDLGNYLTDETDPLFIAWDKNYNDLTNKPDLSEVAISGSYNDLIDKPQGTIPGEIKYWDGDEWKTITPGTTGQVLTLINGVPSWGPQLGMNDAQSPITGKIWMDRNLGADRVAISSTDASAYGHLYQWGRGTDGHQIRTSGTTTTLSSSDTPGHGNYILAPDSPYDWRSPQNDNLWQGVKGINNPCPEGYRLPTEAEINAERLSWTGNDAAGAFNSALKLPMGGFRGSTGALSNVGNHGRYWTSTVSGFNSRYLAFDSSSASIGTSRRSAGRSVRCIKD